MQDGISNAVEDVDVTVMKGHPADINYDSDLKVCVSRRALLSAEDTL